MEQLKGAGMEAVLLIGLCFEIRSKAKQGKSVNNNNANDLEHDFAPRF